MKRRIVTVLLAMTALCGCSAYVDWRDPDPPTITEKSLRKTVDKGIKYYEYRIAIWSSPDLYLRSTNEYMVGSVVDIVERQGDK